MRSRQAFRAVSARPRECGWSLTRAHASWRRAGKAEAANSPQPRAQIALYSNSDSQVQLGFYKGTEQPAETRH